MSMQLSLPEIEAIANPGQRAEVKGLVGIKQALYDVLGGYPLDNVLPYVYGFSLTAAQGTQLAASQTRNASIKITADAAFVGMTVRGASTGDFLTFMRVDNSDRQLMNIPVHSAALVGTGERPAPLHKPLLLPANTTISFDVTDLSAAPNDVYFYLHGFKVYQRRNVG